MGTISIVPVEMEEFGVLSNEGNPLFPLWCVQGCQVTIPCLATLDWRELGQSGLVLQSHEAQEVEVLQDWTSDDSMLSTAAMTGGRVYQ